MAGIYGGIAFSMIIGGTLLGHFKGSVKGAPGVFLALLFVTIVREPKRRNRADGEKPPLLEVFRYLRSNWRYYLPFLLGIALVQIVPVCRRPGGYPSIRAPTERKQPLQAQSWAPRR